MKEIIILGSGPEWQTCPFSTTEKEIWAVAKMVMLNNPPNKIDKLFSMDDIDHLLTIRRGMFTKDEFISKINETNAPYITSVPNSDIDKCEEYPFKEVVNKLKVPYFTNTVCYMIAYALLQGVKKIDLYGIAQMGTNEYSMEKAGVEFWIGIAGGMGVQVNINTPSFLLKTANMDYPYGYVKTITQLMEDKHEK